MLQFLFILSYYTFVYAKNSTSYFQKFRFLEYGFKKNAQFSVDFTRVYSNMVFGLATKKEINEINKLKYMKEYCTGEYQLSALQYNITRRQQIEVEIKRKSILTPYAFTCDKNYSIYAYISISNGNSHSDYRYEIMMITTIVFSAIVFCITIIYGKYTCFNWRSGTKKSLNRYLVLILCIFLVITVYNFAALGCFLPLEYSGDEYLNEIPISAALLWSILNPFLLLFIIMTFYVHPSTYILKFNPKFTIFAHIFLILLCLSFNGLSMVNLLSETKGIFIATCCFYCLIFLIFVITKPIINFFKAGCILYFVWVFVTSVLGRLIFDKTQETFPTLYMIIIFEIVSIISQSISITLILVGIIYFDEFRVIGYTTFYEDNTKYTIQNPTNVINNKNKNKDIKVDINNSNVTDEQINQPLNQQNDN